MARKPLEDDPKKFWGVVDTNATALKPGTDEIMPRVHDMPGGKRYSLRSDEATAMPERHARLFLKDPAFVVTDAQGNEVKAMTEEQMLRVMPRDQRLPANMVIADLTELTNDALKQRAMVHPRSEELPPEADRGLLIDFLQGLFTVGVPQGSDDSLAGDGVDAVRDPAEDARRLLEGG